MFLLFFLIWKIPHSLRDVFKSNILVQRGWRLEVWLFHSKRKKIYQIDIFFIQIDIKYIQIDLFFSFSNEKPRLQGAILSARGKRLGRSSLVFFKNLKTSNSSISKSSSGPAEYAATKKKLKKICSIFGKNSKTGSGSREC